MTEEKATEPLDLSAFDDLKVNSGSPQTSPSLPSDNALMPVTDARLLAEAPPARLVDVSTLSPEDLAAANRSAANLDFRKTNTLLAHGEGTLAEIAQASRQLLTGVSLGDTGEVGRIAASVIDGVKILRIEELQAESSGPKSAAPRFGLIGKLLGAAANAHTAFRSFQENRKKFLDLMDAEQAKARKTKSDLAVSIDLLDQQASAIRRSLYGLKIEIAGGQIALDRGHEELELLRQNALKSGDRPMQPMSWNIAAHWPISAARSRKCAKTWLARRY
ncbi:toxic anion resistance protein [Rhizobium sp. BR 318]